MAIVATKAETHRWASYATMIGFVLSRDGVNLPGMVTVDAANVEKSLASEIQRLKTDYCTIDVVSKKSRSDPWFSPIDDDEISAAVKSAMT